MNKKIEHFYKRIDEILSSEKNPRYTETPLLNKKFMNFFKSDLKNEQEVLKDLLSYEGNLSDFLDLIENIDTVGFKTHIDSIYCIKHNDKYIVVEGNRRISCLKLLTGNLKLPPLDQITFIDIDEDGEEERKSNYDKIVEIIKKSKKEKFAEEIDIAVIRDEDHLYDIIYSRHITGDNIGKRKWGRGKYLFDLYENDKEFNFLENKDMLNTISRKWNRSRAMIKSDLKHAKDMIALLKNVGITKEQKLMNFLLKNKVSSLQRQFIKSSLEPTGITIDAEVWENSEFCKLVYKLFTEYSPLTIKKVRYMSISTRNPNHHFDAIKLINRFIENGTIDTPKIDNISITDIEGLTKDELDIPEIKTKFPKLTERERQKNSYTEEKSKLIGVKGHDQSLEIPSKNQINIAEIIESSISNKNRYSKALEMLYLQHNDLSKMERKHYHALAATSRSLTEVIAFYMLEISEKAFEKFKEKIKKSKIANFQNKNLKEIISSGTLKDKMSKFWDEEIIDSFLEDFKIFENGKYKNTMKTFFKDIANKDKTNALHKYIHEPFRIKEAEEGELIKFEELIKDRIDKINNLNKLFVNIEKNNS